MASGSASHGSHAGRTQPAGDETSPNSEHRLIFMPLRNLSTKLPKRHSLSVTDPDGSDQLRGTLQVLLRPFARQLKGWRRLPGTRVRRDAVVRFRG